MLRAREPKPYGKPMRPANGVLHDQQLSTRTKCVYNTNHPVLAVPALRGNWVPRAVRIWMSPQVAEAGADASNYTQVEFRVGTAASYTVLGAVNTQANPAACTLISANPYKLLQTGDTIFVLWTQVGATSVSYTNKWFSVGVDLVMEQIG